MRRWLPGFVALSAIWGASFALIKVAVEAGVPPLWVALWRCVLGAVTLWTILVLRGERAPRDRALWGHSAVLAVLLNTVPFTLFSFGETRVSSVLAGVMNATTPLFTLLFAVLTVPAERRPGARRLSGLALGFVGVLTVLGVWRGIGSGEAAGGLACLVAACCYGAGFAYLRRFLSGRPESVVTLSAVQIACATVELAFIAPFAAGAPHWPGAGAAGALLVLGAVGTGLAYLLNLGLVRTAGTAVASAVTYVMPLWSTALGAAFLAEPVGWNALVGGVLVIAAVVLTRPRPGPRPAVAAASTAAAVPRPGQTVR
ncbi:drug/metabolite transporter (DMT)-like permease [Kitasatospora sp. MAA19]|uniref:DMT family transporter n=1 Tax=Kitasatospora sp. MAA19 TaxID=3035090 RepID=UPI002474616E|nr:DMT family transporter [Kitasatospora sp. MAA19]MDH6710988.1 drug/metabolite transporter (DMT)-like permease [Kitasatospora sp. MAA19]